ncbi:MAG: hypothetical protein LBG75_01005 [Candidatus Nomurabacteria bacterium]|jgi:hypothetical protein|nr:hypothetical protein [Candidatus Nomurabacteria bacterium]
MGTDNKTFEGEYFEKLRWLEKRCAEKGLTFNDHLTGYGWSVSAHPNAKWPISQSLGPNDLKMVEESSIDTVRQADVIPSIEVLLLFCLYLDACPVGLRVASPGFILTREDADTGIKEEKVLVVGRDSDGVYIDGQYQNLLSFYETATFSA